MHACVRSFDNLNQLPERELKCEGKCEHKFVAVPVSQRECKRVRVCVHVWVGASVHLLVRMCVCMILPANSQEYTAAGASARVHGI